MAIPPNKNVPSSTGRRPTLDERGLPTPKQTPPMPKVSPPKPTNEK